MQKHAKTAISACGFMCMLLSMSPVIASNTALLTFQKGNDINLDIGKRGCLLQHELNGEKPLLSINLLAQNDQATPNSTIRLHNGFNQYGAVGTLVIKHGDTHLQAAGESLKLHVEAARLFKTNDWDAYDIAMSKAEEMDESVDPRFKQLSVQVDNMSLYQYVKSERERTPFNSSKMKAVQISLKDVPISDSNAQALSYNEADFRFEGQCNVIVKKQSD